MTRFTTLLLLIIVTALPALAERPRPLGWAMNEMRRGNWEAAKNLAAKDGPVARDVIEWHHLRTGQGSYGDLVGFLERRPDWPGEPYLRRHSEPAVITRGDAEILAFFAQSPAQTPRGVLAHAAALTRKGDTGGAQANVVLAWRTMPMNTTSQAAFLEGYATLLQPHHGARLDAMLWAREHDAARQMLDLVTKDQRTVAQARIALQRRAGNAPALVEAVPAALKDDAGLNHDLFEWRIRKNRVGDAKTLLVQRSTSAKALGQPEAWGNRRRALARGEMRSGDKQRAYVMASQHFMTEGSHYADLEWLSGYIALRFLKDPEVAYQHFLNHDGAVTSPISQGRAGYWQGRALDAMGRAAEARLAYATAAQYQSSFYGLMAADRIDAPFDVRLAGPATPPDWRGSALVKDPLFEAGLLLQASGERSVAERFWTHFAERLEERDLDLLGQAAIDAGQPHLAVMIGKRAAQRGLTIAAPYYALHPLAQENLPMAAEMSLAIARRESEFDPVVQSSVGARGLMQIMPATAREVAQGLGILAQHATERLIKDPEYNARLGAQYLSTLAGMFDGNPVMMAAAYNAGPSRPIRWMRDYGDPREGDIDVVDWIEMIPFRETQNYVMRVTESLPIYRARLGKDPLPVPFAQELTGSSLLPFAPKRE